MNFLDDLYENRLLVFIEGDDGNFRQVLLDEKQFAKVSDAIIVDRPPEEQHDLRPGYEIVECNVNEEREIPGDLFIGMSSIMVE